MPPAHTDHSRHDVQNEEELFDDVHANPSSTVYQVVFETGLSESAVWHTLHEDELDLFNAQFL
jgi:hypothetical protein